MSERASHHSRVVDFRAFRDARQPGAGSERPSPSPARTVLSDRQIEHRRAMLANLSRPRLIRALF